ncbi:MAG TPA: hypothetical protein VFF30_19475 [Nitrososphaerales archaeon]|nr:hypothetical protein [Nitrososphaerales archaeon]
MTPSTSAPALRAVVIGTAIATIACGAPTPAYSARMLTQSYFKA